LGFAKNIYPGSTHSDAWYENMDNGELNGVVFIDIRKAFDSINHIIS
jgi:hypothetical protein